jgi:hypothetical protein
MAKYINLLDDGVEIIKKQYQNKRTALIAVNITTGEELCTCSVNIPEYPLDEEDIIIKDYSENEGVLDDLITKGIVSEPIDWITSGHVLVPICKLLI